MATSGCLRIGRRRRRRRRCPAAAAALVVPFCLLLSAPLYNLARPGASASAPANCLWAPTAAAPTSTPLRRGRLPGWQVRVRGGLQLELAGGGGRRHTNPSSPSLKGSYTSTTYIYYARGVAVSPDGKYAYVTGSNSHSLAVVDVGTSPSSPSLKGSYSTSPTPKGWPSPRMASTRT